MTDPIRSEPTYTHAEVRRMMDELSASAKAYGLEVVTTITGPNTAALGLRRIDPHPAADERVAEHMRLVDRVSAAAATYGIAQTLNRAQATRALAEENVALAAVESSARALLAAERDAADAKMEADCWAIMTPDGSKLVSPQEAAGRKDAYPLYAHAAFASTAADLIDAKATIAALQAQIAELSAPQPAADERVAEHMRVAMDDDGEFGGFGTAEHRAAVESSARALLVAGREDAEMLNAIEAHTNWELAYTREPEDDEPWEVYARTGPVNDQEWNVIAKGKTVREAIRSAMRKAKS